MVPRAPEDDNHGHRMRRKPEAEAAMWGLESVFRRGWGARPEEHTHGRGLYGHRPPSSGHQPCVMGVYDESPVWNPPQGWGQTPTTMDKLMHGGDRPFIGELVTDT